jgi:hypothetical protein
VGTQSVLCPVCQGVLPATGRESYTSLRARLIVTNGYCAGTCADRQAESEQTRQIARPVAAPAAASQPVEHGQQAAEAAQVLRFAPPVRVG